MARIEESLNGTVDRAVLRWFFGHGAPTLARVTLEAPINEDRTLLINLVQQMVNMGARVPVGAVARRLNVPLAGAGAAEGDVLRPPMNPVTTVHEPAATALAQAFNGEGA